MATRYRLGFFPGRHQTRPEKRITTTSVSGMLATLKMLGVSSLNRQLGWLATCSFFAGLALASL